MCFGTSSSRRLRACDRVQHLHLIVAVPLDPFPPPSASSSPQAAAHPWANSGGLARSSPSSSSLRSLGRLFPVSSPSCSLSSPNPELMRVHTRPRRRTRVRGDASSTPSSPAYISPPRGLSTSPSPLPHSTIPPQPLPRAPEPLCSSSVRHGRRLGSARLARSRASPSSSPPPEISSIDLDPLQCFPSLLGGSVLRVRRSPKASYAGARVAIALVHPTVHGWALEMRRSPLSSSMCGASPQASSGLALPRPGAGERKEMTTPTPPCQLAAGPACQPHVVDRSAPGG